MVTLAEIDLLEREGELRELRLRLEEARSGAGRLVIIEGEAGIGKTALVRALGAEAQRAGMRVLSARGTELERDFPFSIVHQLFEPALAGATPEQRHELLAGAARLAGGLVGAADPGGDDPDGESAGPDGESAGLAATSLLDPTFATLNALFWLTSNLAEAQPVAVVIDDAHWADAASLRFVEFLLPRLEDVAVLLVLAARPVEPGTEADALARVSTDAMAQVIRPRALSEAAVGQMVRAALGPEADEAFCQTCREATRGNPFMLRELLVELGEEGSSATAEDVGLVREMAPTAIRRAVLVRLARLPEAAGRLARAVAVLGDDCETRHAAALAELDPDTAAGAADAMAAAGILEAGPRLRFAHPLVRNAIHTDLAPAERAAAHGHAARLLADARAEPERVALHLMESTPAGDDAVVDLLTAAAQRAIDRAAPEAAMRYLQRALDEPARPDLRPALTRMQLIAGSRLGDRHLAPNVPEEALAELSTSPDDLVASAWPLAMWLFSVGRADEAASLLDRAAALAAERGDSELALSLEALYASSSLLSPAQARERIGRHAVSLTPGSGGERLWLALDSWCGTFLGETAARTGALARRALADGRIFAEQPESPPPSQAILVLARTEQMDLAADRIEALAAEASARGSAFSLARASFLRASVEWLRGNVARAEAEARTAVEAGRAGGWLATAPIYVTVLVDILVDRGDLDRAEEELVRAGYTGPVPENYWWTPVLVSRGRLRLAQHRFDEAAADLLQAQTHNEHAGISNALHFLGSHLALAQAGAGKPEAARASAAQELERARSWGTPGTIGAALRVCALLESGEQQLAMLAEAVEVLEGSAMCLEFMRALVDLGAALRRANRRADARAPLRQALELARRGGALAIAQRASDELAATGEKVRPQLVVGVESLTPSERRVAELAAQGLSNREIAQALFLTVKTVEGHLSHAYRKLDIGSRRELARALDE